MNLELLKHAKGYIEKMANGINPLTGESIPDSDFVNNVRISRCLFYVNDILGEVLLNRGISKKISKIPFNMDRETINKYEFTDEELPISKIVKKINNLKVDEYMNDLKVKDVCEWLMSLDLLCINEDAGNKRKIPTESGKNMGMYIEHRIGTYGSYDVVMYKKQMQEFIIDNFECLLDYINKQ